MTSVVVAAAVVLAVLAEGRTILVCLSAPAAGGAARLTRLGSIFLGTEAWVIAVIGMVNGVHPDLAHPLLEAAGGGAVAYIAGWMVRDLFLWAGPRLGPGLPARVLIAVGASAQVVGAAVLGVALVAALVSTGPPDAGPPGDLLGFVLLPVLVAGLVIQVGLVRLPPASYFRWAEGARPPADARVN